MSLHSSQKFLSDFDVFVSLLFELKIHFHCLARAGHKSFVFAATAEGLQSRSAGKTVVFERVIARRN
jgi:hypothetical protein